MRTPTLALTGLMLTTASPAFAQGIGDAGGKFLTTINHVLTGNIMLAVGLIVAVLGLWMWLVKQETSAGIMMIIGGVILTAAPAIFNATSTVVNPVVDSAGMRFEDSQARTNDGLNSSE